MLMIFWALIRARSAYVKPLLAGAVMPAGVLKAISY